MKIAKLVSTNTRQDLNGAPAKARFILDEISQTFTIENMVAVNSFWSNPPITSLTINFNDVKYFYVCRAKFLNAKNPLFRLPHWGQLLVLVTTQGRISVPSYMSKYEQVLLVLSRSCKKRFTSPETIITWVVIIASVIALAWFFVAKLGV